MHVFFCFLLLDSTLFFDFDLISVSQQQKKIKFELAIMRRPKYARKKESERLNVQAKHMEDRLVKLRARMKMQKDTAKKCGGWASSKTERGSLTRYARDVRKRDTESKMKKRFRKTNQVKHNNSSKTVEQWECRDVISWLESTIGLIQYRDVFEKNHINGKVLLEMGGDDLDFLNIRFPAHRKIILKGVDVLKKLPMKKKIHWAEAACRAEQKARENPQGAQVMINSADQQQSISLLHGTYDEAAQRRAFQEAVMAWRRGDDDVPSTSSSKTMMWKNPFDEEEKQHEKGGLLLEGEYDEEAQRREFQKAVMEWRNAGKTTKKTTKKRESASTETSTTNGILLNEEEERERFKKAVHQWRTSRHRNKAQEHAQIVKDLEHQMDQDHDMKIKNIHSERETYRNIKEERRDIEARLKELLLKKEKETTATPLDYNVWDVDIKF